jgi:hypothetical protein
MEQQENEQEQKILEMYEIQIIDQKKNLVRGKNDLMQQLKC